MKNFLGGAATMLGFILLTAAASAVLQVTGGGTGVRSVSTNAVLIDRGGSAALVESTIPGCAQLGYDDMSHAFVCNATSTTLAPTTTTEAATTTTITTTTAAATTTTT
jgi:hypothetical protein